MGCLFTIDSDAHAPGQLDWVGYGCARAENMGITPERILNSLPADGFLGRTRQPRGA